MWPFWWKGASGFSAHSTAEEVTHGIDGTALTAIVTGPLLPQLFFYHLGSFDAALLTDSAVKSLWVIQLIQERTKLYYFAGASSGIGEETTRVLALRGVHVVMAVRNTDSGNQVRAKILKDTPEAKIDVMKLDLSSMASVRSFASQYKSLDLPLNLLM